MTTSYVGSSGDPWVSALTPGIPISTPTDSTIRDIISKSAGDTPLAPTSSDDASKQYYDDSTIADVNISGKPYRFNPPMHATNLPARVDFTNADQSHSSQNAVAGSMVDYLREQQVANNSSLSPKDFNALRLGRIIQGDISSGNAADGPNRWGFRFHYNPASWNTSSSKNDQVILDPRSRSNMVLAGMQTQTFQSHTFQLLLNRQPDVMAGRSLSRDSYSPRLTNEDLAGILRYGTNWDLEYLCRVANGLMNTRNNGRSGNIGMLRPVPSYLVVGKGMRHFGFVSSFNYTHTMFSPNMVPLLTTVTVVFRRIVDLAPSDADAYADRLSEAVATLPDFGDGATDDGSGTSGAITDPGSGGSGKSISVAEVIRNAQTIKAYATGRCLETVRRVLEQSSMGESSAASFAAMTASRGHMHTDYDAPLGSIQMWTGGSQGYGHITVSAGGGYCWTTDWHGALAETKVKARDITSDWHLTYAGWSEWYGSTKLNTSTSTA